jgi:hypothetical protein
MPRGSKVLGRHRNRAARGSISYRVLASHPDSCCHKIVTAHGPVVKDAGKALGHSLARECSQFRKRRCRASTLPLATLLMNQVNGALRADDIVHETKGMRSSNDPEPERRGRALTDTMPTRPPDAARTTAAGSRPAGWRKDVDWPQNARSTAGLCPSISARREIAS